MKVILLSHTPHPEKLVASSAKLCYSSSDIETLMEGLTEGKVDSFLETLVGYNHFSPLEHMVFTFGIEGVSRSLTHQLVRHRIASYSQKSQRYVKESMFEYIVPKEIEKNKEAKEIYIQTMEDIQKSYDTITMQLYNQYIEKLSEEEKIDKKRTNKLMKKAIENARYVLPNACETKIIVTMNARSLLNFFTERCCANAQDEIRELANQMLTLCKQVAPTVFKNAGASCKRGQCKEGKKSCGIKGS